MAKNTGVAANGGLPDYDARRRYVGDVAAHYEAGRRGKRRWQSEQEIVGDLIRTRMAPGDVVLDVPFGTGRFCRYYAEAGVKVRAVDISSDMLKAALRELGEKPSYVSLAVGDAVHLPLPDASVDHVVCVRLLGHLPPEVVARVLTEFRRVARRTVIIHLPVRDLSPVSALRRAAGAALSAPMSVSRRAVRSARRAAGRVLRGHANVAAGERPLRRYRPLSMNTVLGLTERDGWRVVKAITRDEGSDAIWAVFTPITFFVAGHVDPLA